MTLAVDALAVAVMPETMPYKYKAIQEYANDGRGITEQEMLQEMDDAGVEAAVLAAYRIEIEGQETALRDIVKSLIDRHPRRFFGLIGVDVHQPALSIREAVRAIDSWGFKGLHINPGKMQLPPNAPAYDPLYRLALELDVPFVMQIGNNFQKRYVHLVDKAMMEAVQRHDAAKTRPYRAWFCHPVYLDDVCRRFPDLRIVASHGGWPWTQDLLDLMTEHKHLYAEMSVYYPSVWESCLLEFIKGPGAHKVMWATNYPEVRWVRAMEELRQLGLPAEIHDRVIRQNVVDLYRLGP